MSTPNPLSDEDLAKYIQAAGGVSSIPEQNQALEQQLKLAEQLRQGPNMPKGEIIPEHSVYVGPNALQSGAAALHQGLAMYRGQQLSDKMMQNASKQQDARTMQMQMIADLIRNRTGQGQSQQGQPITPTSPVITPDEVGGQGYQ